MRREPSEKTSKETLKSPERGGRVSAKHSQSAELVILSTVAQSRGRTWRQYVTALFTFTAE